MIKLPHSRNRTPSDQGAAGDAGEQLTFVVELWDMARSKPERVIGRAESLEVASAIYAAALQELPVRLIVLRRGSEVLRSTR